MNSSLSEQILELRHRVQEAEHAQAKAEAVYEHALQAAQAARTRLEEEFSVGTLADAKALLTRMEHQIGDRIRQISASLDENGL